MDTSMQTQIVLLHPRLTKHKVPRRGGCAFGGHFLSTLGLRSLHRQVSKKHICINCMHLATKQRVNRESIVSMPVHM